MSSSIHETALRLLARRALARRELADRLARKEHEPAQIEAELQRLEAAGLLDEHELARAICRSRLRQGKGRRAIAGELWRRGIVPEVAEAALAELTQTGTMAALEAAVARATSRHPRWQELPRERAKVIRYLLTRGFDAAEVRRILGREPDEENDAGATFDTGDP